jgi:hypothetical protein
MGDVCECQQLFPQAMLRPALAILALIALASPVLAAPEKRVWRVDSVVATRHGGSILVQARGAVQGGGWEHPRLKLSHRDGHTMVVEFLAQPPAPGAPVISGLLPVTAKATIRAERGAVTVKAMAEANDVTAQILH